MKLTSTLFRDYADTDHGDRADPAYRAEMEKQGRNADLPPNHPVNALSRAHKFLILCTLSFSGCLMNFM